MKRKTLIVLMELFCLMLLVGCGAKSPENNQLPTMEKTILDNKTLWGDNDNLYEIPLAALEGVSQSQVQRFGDNLLLTYEEYDAEKEQFFYEIKILSLEDGKVLYEKQLESLMYGVVQVLDNHIAVNDLGDGKCYLLNSELELLDTYELPGGMFCIDKNGEKAYQFTYNQGLKVVDLASGKETILLENGVNM